MKLRVLALATSVLALGGVALSGQADLAKLKDPAALTEKAPDTFKANFETSKGLVVIEAHRDWSPIGADRFYNLVKNGFYDGCRFFRVLDGFMAQVGMNGDPNIQRVWGGANIKDDPVTKSNTRGFVSFAKTGAPDSRSTQFFVNFANNNGLDKQGFSPFGEVTTGMKVVDDLYNGYGRNNVPNQGQISAEGNAYLNREYPRLDFIKSATIAAD
jgi:peptidyl-prolyl cis-trans isomerase A (cyclophilin A)